MLLSVINFIYSSSAAFPALKTRRQGRRGQVRYHYMGLQFVNLSTRPPKFMWENNSDESDSDGSTRKRGGAKKTAVANKRGKVSTGCSAPIPATTTTKTSNATTEETYEEEETAIVRCEFPSQPTTPSYAAPCCASSEDEGDQSFYNSCDDLVALSQGSMLPFLQQPPLPPADLNEWMTTISDDPAYAAPPPPPASFPVCDASLAFLDFNNTTCHNTNTYLNNVGCDNPPGLNLEEHLVRALELQRQEEAMMAARTPFQPTHKADTTWVAFPFKNLLRLRDPCDQGSMAPTSFQL